MFPVSKLGVKFTLMSKPSTLPRAVSTITPQRLSFAGGGTDLPDFYRQHGGAVVSTTIDKYIYVTVKRHSRLFDEAYRLSYSKTELVNNLDEIENDVARECLRLVPVDPPLFIATAADIPASSGLGSSSSFAVGLLYALHTLRGEDVSVGQLAEEATHVEIEMLGHPIGKQDQYAAAFGGLNYITFNSNGRVHLDPLWLPNGGADTLFSNSMLFWTKMQREAGHILEEQRAMISNTAGTLVKMRDMAAECRDALLMSHEDLRIFGKILDSGWQAKRSLASKISSSQIDVYYAQALEAGALGGKIAGAGGGGFLYLVVPLKSQERVRAALSDMVDVLIKYEPRGVRLLSVV